MEQVILSIVYSFFITVYCIPVIIRVAKAKKLFDIPDDFRKLHKGPIPSLGGVALFIGIIVSLLLESEIWVSNPEFSIYTATFVIIFFLGLKDDILVISPWKKLVGQIIVAIILTTQANLLINNMHGFLGIWQIPTTFSYLLTIFTFVVVINAFNLIDGIDGLAGSVALVAACCFGAYYLLNLHFSYAILAFSLAASLLAFLLFNFQPAKIFMGDSGAMLTGLIISILSVKFIEIAPNSNKFPVSASPVLGFGFILLPLMDTLRVFSLRMIKARSPFSPDRNHIHHLLQDRGLNHRSIAFFSAIISLAFSALSYYLSIKLGCTLGIAILIAVFFFYVQILFWTRKKSSKDYLRVTVAGEERA